MNRFSKSSILKKLDDLQKKHPSSGLYIAFVDKTDKGWEIACNVGNAQKRQIKRITGIFQTMDEALQEIDRIASQYDSGASLTVLIDEGLE